MAMKDAKKTELKERRKAPLVTPTDLGSKASVDISGGMNAILADVLRKEKLRLALDQLVHFAHWITPANMPKRFDTHFFLASSPIGHAGSHDGRESVDSIWITPKGAISDRKKWNVIFPTKLNLMKLANSATVSEAIATARATKVLPVTPWVESSAEGQVLRIREDAGYAQTSANMRDGL